MFAKIKEYLIGKNLPHLYRVILSAIGFGLLSLSIYDPAGQPLDPAMAEAAQQIPVPSRAEIEDGLTLSEVFYALFGALTLMVSSGISWARAKFPTVTGWLAPFVGRSWHSFGRRMLTGLGVLVAGWLGSDTAPDVLVNQPLETLLSQAAALLVPILIGNKWSATQDAKQNPVKTSLR